MFVDIMVFGVPILFLLVWLIADLWIKLVIRAQRGQENYPTITGKIQTLSSQYIAIPLMTGLIIGLILGHLFGQF